jgi:hypothetical protein
MLTVLNTPDCIIYSGIPERITDRANLYILMAKAVSKVDDKLEVKVPRILFQTAQTLGVERIHPGNFEAIPSQVMSDKLAIDVMLDLYVGPGIKYTPVYDGKYTYLIPG